MAKYTVEDTSLTNIANAIREKTGTTELLKPSEMPSAIASIEAGGGKYKPRHISFYQYAGTELNEELANLDTSDITNMSYMFGNTKLTSLDVSNFDTSKVTNMSYMFYSSSIGNIKIEELDLSSFDTSNVTNMAHMFRNLGYTTKLDIRNFTFDKVTNSASMFSNFKNSCLIIVKGETEKEWITSRFTSLTNVKTVAEYQAEGGV